MVPFDVVLIVNVTFHVRFNEFFFSKIPECHSAAFFHDTIMLDWILLISLCFFLFIYFRYLLPRHAVSFPLVIWLNSNEKQTRTQDTSAQTHSRLRKKQTILHSTDKCLGLAGFSFKMRVQTVIPCLLCSQLSVTTWRCYICRVSTLHYTVPTMPHKSHSIKKAREP